MKFTNLLTDDAVLLELGLRLQRARLDRGLTQADLAERAGLSKRTIERIEDGASTQMSSLVRVLRALEFVGGLELLVPEAGPGPMELLRRKGKSRQRASRRRDQEPDGAWTWGDEA